MELFIDFLKIILPALVVLYAMYLMVKSFIERDLKGKDLDLKIAIQKEILPVRLQAYERICLYLERIHPKNQLLRLSERHLDVKQFQEILIHEIREELNHNLSQQVYMSDEAWNLVTKTTEDLIALINTSAANLTEEGQKSTDLAKEILKTVIGWGNDPFENALSFIKQEIREKIM